MSDARITSENNGVRYGLLTGVAMIVYFVVASLLDLTDRISFSFLNIIILAIGVCMAIARMKRAKDDRMPYLQGFGTGIITALVASALLALFFIVYAGFINKSIIEELRASDYFGFDLTVTVAFLAIILQGAMSGVIISLVAMQYFKSPDHKPMQGIE